MKRLPWLLLLLTTDALAGGYFFPDSGVVATGRGGAFIASADDTFAQYYNPGALSRLDRWTIDIGLSGVGQDLEFARLLEDGTLAEPVRNSGGLFTVPQFGVGGPLVKDKLFLAVGLYTAYAPSFEYPDDGAQRYTLLDSSIWQAFIGPSVAFKPIPQLSVGIGLQWQFLAVGQHLKVTTNGTDDTISDIDIDVDTFDPFAPSANFGVLIQPIDLLSIGLTAQLASSFDAKGTMAADFDGALISDFMVETLLTDDDVTLGLRLPMVLKGGVALHPKPGSAIEFAVVWENWSSLTSLELTDIQLDLEFTNPFIETDVADSLSLPASFRDTVSLRLGGSYDLFPELTLRAGGFYETGSQADEVLNVSLYDPYKIQVSGGASVHLLEDRLHVDVSFANVFYPNKEVRNSTITQTNVQGGDVLTVGNGDFRSNGFVLAGGLSWSFGKG